MLSVTLASLVGALLVVQPISALDCELDRGLFSYAKAGRLHAFLQVMSYTRLCLVLEMCVYVVYENVPSERSANPAKLESRTRRHSLVSMCFIQSKSHVASCWKGFQWFVGI